MNCKTHAELLAELTAKFGADLKNHVNQLNPNNNAYWRSRNYLERPDEWEEILEKEGVKHLNGRFV